MVDRIGSVYIRDIGYSLGEETRSVEDAARAGVTVTGAKELREAGFRRHHVSARGATAYDLARRAVGDATDRRDDIDVIVYATCIPSNANLVSHQKFEATRDVKDLMCFPASRLQAELGLERAFVVGINQQACTGTLGSVRVARALLLAEPSLRSALCVSADRFPEGALYEQAYNLISDGATACVVSTVASDVAYRVLACHALTNGALASATDDETVGTFFPYALRAVRETMERAGLGPRDITWVIPQNTHPAAWTVIARALEIDPQRFCTVTLPEVGHVISGDCLINLKELERSGAIHAGDHLLLFMAGYGLNWQCVALERC